MSAALQHPVVDVELEAPDARRRPGGTRQLVSQLIDQEVQQLLTHRQRIGNPKHELHVRRRFEHALLHQRLGVVQHRGIEDLDLGLHLVGQHVLGKVVDQLRRVLVDDGREIDRAGGERGHVRLQLDRRAALLRGPAASAGRELDDHAGTMFQDPRLHLAEQVDVRARFALGIAHMDVHQARARFERCVRAFHLFGGLDRHGGVLRLARLAAGDRHGDDRWSAHASAS
jgi:hypothetical protein